MLLHAQNAATSQGADTHATCQRFVSPADTSSSQGARQHASFQRASSAEGAHKNR